MKSLGWVLPQPDWSPYKKRGSGYTCTEIRWSRRHRETMPAANQGERPQTCWSQASSLLSCKEIHFCGISCLVCGTLVVSLKDVYYGHQELLECWGFEISIPSSWNAFPQIFSWLLPHLQGFPPMSPFWWGLSGFSVYNRSPCTFPIPRSFENLFFPLFLFYGRRILFLIFISYQFVYSFVCPGSQLWHTGSSTFFVGSSTCSMRNL